LHGFSVGPDASRKLDDEAESWKVDSKALGTVPVVLHGVVN
jgi:hypothetical protein